MPAKRFTPFKSPEDLVQAAREGNLPKHFSLTLDNDSVYGQVPLDPAEYEAWEAGGCEGDEPDCADALAFDMGPREFLSHALTALGIPNENA